MEQQWKNRYDLFLLELSAVSSKSLFTESSIEKSLLICNRTLDQLKFDTASFRNEPVFLKNVYPHFLAEAEYLKYIAYLTLFCPQANTTQRNETYFLNGKNNDSKNSNSSIVHFLNITTPAQLSKMKTISEIVPGII